MMEAKIHPQMWKSKSALRSLPLLGPAFHIKNIGVKPAFPSGSPHGQVVQLWTSYQIVFSLSPAKWDELIF